MAFLDVRSAHMRGRLHLSLHTSTHQPLPCMKVDENVIYCVKEGTEFCVNTCTSSIVGTTDDTILFVTLRIDGERIGYSQSISCYAQSSESSIFDYVLREKGEFALTFQKAPTSYATATLHPRQAKLGTIEAIFTLYRVKLDTPPKTVSRSSTSLPSMKTVPENKKCCDRASLVAGDGRFLAPLENGTFTRHPLISPALGTYTLTVHYHNAMVYNILRSRKLRREEEEESSEEEESDEDSVEILPPPPPPPRVIIDLTEDEVTPKRRQANTRTTSNQRRRI